ncbi:hypothetical protein RJ641_012419 [Dillenia turbinata]|uniref:DUF4219 domain-containing protein n=1 Tax=Dillenia turbinata TaxID=194707 RepID=A0AAN8V702_9MAGN
MASENFVQPSIPHFDGHYAHWSMLMENFLRSKEYWQVVSNGILEAAAGAADAEVEALKLKDLKAKNYSFQAIDRSILETILCKMEAKAKDLRITRISSSNQILKEKERDVVDLIQVLTAQGQETSLILSAIVVTGWV